MARKYKRKRKITKKKRRVVRRRRDPKYPLGQRYTTTLKYVQQVRFNSQTDGQGILATFSANSLYDPMASGTTDHQPMGFDQLCGANNSGAFFQEYTVIGSKITCNIMGLSNNNAILCLHKGQESFSLTDGIEKVLENGNVVYRMIPGSGNNVENSSATTSGYSGSNKFILRANYSPVKDGLVTKGNIFTSGQESGLTASYNMDPAQEYYYNLVMLPFNQEGGTGYTNEAVGTISGLIIMEYRVVFTNPNIMVQS